MEYIRNMICIVALMNASFMYSQTNGITLNDVPNQDTISTFNPIFTWTISPTIPIGVRTTRILTIVELTSSQTPTDGLLYNTPLFVSSELKTNALLYPLSAIKLETGKRYGWNVKLYEDGVLVTSSSDWEFTLTSPSQFSSFLPLKVMPDGIFPKVGTYVRFTCDKSINTEVVSVKLFDEDGSEVSLQGTNSQTSGNAQNQIPFIKHNDNFFELELPGPLTQGKYTIKVMNKSKIIGYVLFEN